MFQRLSDAEMMDKSCVANIDELLQKKTIKNSQLMDIIQFGRILHAEMSHLWTLRAWAAQLEICDPFLHHVPLPHLR